MNHTTTMRTPTGDLTIIADDAGAVLAAGFDTEVAALLDLVHPRLRAAPRPRADLGPVTRAVASYLDGELTAPDEVPVRQHSDGVFLTIAWEELRRVKPGSTVTYTELARLAGRPAAVRAAAQACARNATALFVPCHRVIRTDGSLGGYRYSLPVKRWLLSHETDMRNV